MRLFSALYDRVLKWAQHRHAPYYLACLSFTEASFFPIPPDLMLMPMAISQPSRAWWYAALTTGSSVLGGIFGYILGAFFIAIVEPYLARFGYIGAYHHVQNWFNVWGFYTLFFAGFMPIPYKVFTIASGAVNMPILSFVVASLVGRGSRFFLVSGLMRIGGEKMKNSFRKYVDWAGWVSLAIIGILLIYFYYR